MDNMSGIDIITNLGFPIGLSVILLYALRSYVDKYITLNEKSITMLERVATLMASNNTNNEETIRVIEANTQALKDTIEVNQKILAKLGSI